MTAAPSKVLADVLWTEKYRPTTLDQLGLDPETRTLLASYLAAGGIAADRMEVFGFGESKPVASNATADGRAQNRRVELRIRSGE